MKGPQTVMGQCSIVEDYLSGGREEVLCYPSSDDSQEGDMADFASLQFQASLLSYWLWVA